MADDLDVTGQENVLPTDAQNLTTSIETAFDKTVTPDAPVKADAPPLELTPPPSPGDGRARDEHGRFIAKDGSAPGAAPVAPVPTAPAIAAPATPAPPQFNEAPPSWKPEAKAFYDKVPAEIRPYLHQREQELVHGFDAVARRGNVAEAVLNEFVPYAEQLQAEGATPISAMRTLLQTAHQLRTGGPEYRKAMLLSLAQQYGVDLSQPVNLDIAKAEAQSAQLLTEKMYGSAANQQQTVQQTTQEFSAFAADPANVYFQEVRPIMALLIENNVAPNLRTAYDMAIGMHAGVRDKLLEQNYQTRMQAEKSARAATVGIKGAPNGAGVRQTAPGNESLRATIERQFGDA